MKRLNNERGIALAVAIFALVVVGGLVAGSLFVATQEQRVGRNTLQQQTAFNAARRANESFANALVGIGTPAAAAKKSGKTPHARTSG